MTPEISSYISSVVTIIAAFIYFLTYRFQKTKIDLLQNSIDSQSKVISDFEKYKSLFDISDFEKRLELKLDNQKMELSKSFNLQTQKSVDSALQKFSQQVTLSMQQGMAGWEELIEIANNITLIEYPDKKQKIKRDIYIKKHYPKNADFMIHFIDDYLDGKIPQTGPVK